jgi:hypothetical protein
MKSEKTYPSGFYELGTDVRPTARLADAFAELAPRDLIRARTDRSTTPGIGPMQQCRPPSKELRHELQEGARQHTAPIRLR